MDGGSKWRRGGSRGGSVSQPLRELDFIPQSLASFMRGSVRAEGCWRAAAGCCWLMLRAGREGLTDISSRYTCLEK
jgi:hypothetical protein